MKIVGKDKEVDTKISFRTWRKFAACHHIPYESWEEGKVVLLNDVTKKLMSNLR